MKKAALAMLGALVTLPAGAFTLDFVGDIGKTVPPSLTINVPGYGDVRFDAGFTSNLEVGDAYRNDDGSAAVSLQMLEGESVSVVFLAAEPLNVDFDYVGVSSGEFFQTIQTGQNSYLIALQGSGDGAGLEAISFNVVPEPSTALLGLLGMSCLLLRRRR